jgi:beta-glucosidase
MQIVLIVCLSSYFLFAGIPEDAPAYLNPDLPVAVRVDDLVARMTLAEKVSQMVNHTAAIPRLQVPEYDWWGECLHGVANAGIATVFPQAIGLAATWDTDLMFRVADVISTEARAKHHDFVRQGNRNIFRGLTFWSPNVNIFRDPRWGRGQETYGEDPYLSGRMGVAFVKGLQGNDPQYFKVISTPKHYTVHSGPEPERHVFDAVIDDRDLYDTYLPAFEACVREAGAYSVMCAYNRYLGEACCGAPKLLHKILREEWGFKGYIVSDCGAINDIYANHQIVKTLPEAAALAVKSGTDLNCGQTYSNTLMEAVAQGLITEAEIDVAVKRLFTARFKLGMFDPSELVQYSQIPISENDSPEHRQLSVQAARESIVLLKNENNLLPLSKDVKKIAVIGPTADSYRMLLGNYNGKPSRYVTPLQGIENKVGKAVEVAYEPGCNLVEKGGLIYPLSAEMVNADGKPGLKLEFYQNRNFEGQPTLTKIDHLDEPNLIWGCGIPNLWLEPQFSFRWSGTLKVKETGDYNFAMKSNGGFRLYIDDKLVVEDWQKQEPSEKVVTRSGNLHLDRKQSYQIKIEYYKSGYWPQLFVQWHLIDSNHFRKAVKLAKDADVVIFVGGITAQLEGEEIPVELEGFKGGDRTSLDLPWVQEDLLKMIYATKKPVVLVLTSGSALAVNWAAANIPAILQIWYPGQEGGTALADILFGDYNPGGRLPVTFYQSVDQLPPFEDYRMKGRTYRYFGGQPLYPFGYGLSYTRFAYSNLQLPGSIKAGEQLKVTAMVKNTGKVSGDEVVQLYVKDQLASVPVPICALQGFKRVHLSPGEQREVVFELTPRQLAAIQIRSDGEGIRRVVEPGKFEITVGGILPDGTSATTECISREIEVVGEPFLVE